MSNDTRRRTLVASALTLFPLALAGVGAAHAQEGDAPRVSVDHRMVNFQGQPPVEQQGRVLVPLRGVLEKIGAYVQYDAASHTVTAFRGNTRILLTIGSQQATVGDRNVTLDVPAQLINGSTLVPLRFVAESLGARVDFDAGSNTVHIDTDRSADAASAENPPLPAPPGGQPAPPPPDPDGARDRDRDWHHDHGRNGVVTGSVVAVYPNEQPQRITLRLPDPRDGSRTMDRSFPLRNDAAVSVQRPNDTTFRIPLDHLRRDEPVSATIGEGGQVASIHVIAPAFDPHPRPEDGGRMRGEVAEVRPRPDGLVTIRTRDGHEVVLPGSAEVQFRDQKLHVHDIRPGDAVTIALDPVTHHAVRIIINP